MILILEWKRVALGICLVAGLTCAGWEQPAGAASTMAKKVVPLRAVPSASANQVKPSVSRMPQRPIGKGTGRQSLQNGRRKEDSTDHVLSNRGRGKVSGQGASTGGAEKARQSLAYHGILEQPQRYDPGRDLRKSKGAAPNPEARDLQIEHFQELDRNQDGVLDPLERAVGRLDIERDMNKR